VPLPLFLLPLVPPLAPPPVLLLVLPLVLLLVQTLQKSKVTEAKKADLK